MTGGIGVPLVNIGVPTAMFVVCPGSVGARAEKFTTTLVVPPTASVPIFVQLRVPTPCEFGADVAFR